MPKAVKTGELEATRDRLLDAASSVFADCGFRAATVRDICAKAKVNIAAVNYHFGDKLGLYTEVLKRASGAEEQARIRLAMSECASPEEALRIFVRGMFDKICRDDGPSLHIKIMVQELANPTPALNSVVDYMIRPLYEELCELIARVLGRRRNDTTTRLCVHSLLGQVTHYAHARAILSRLWPELRFTPERRHEIADHIVQFTLGGMRTAKPGKREVLGKREVVGKR
jgi:AcrR family transcriptional regulator